MSKYIPPQLRRQAPGQDSPRSLTRAIDELTLSTKETNNSSGTISKDHTNRVDSVKYSSQDVRSEKKKEKQHDDYQSSQLERHGDLQSEETIYLTEYFKSNSFMFNTWKRVREEGYQNEHIASFFVRKRASQDAIGSSKSGVNFADRKRRKGAFTGAPVNKIFKQFYSYAIDIDNGVQYTEISSKFSSISTPNEKFWFIDFGFAPGGMTDLILQTCPEAHGVGVTLEANKGGNVYLPYLENSPRFHVLQGDVIQLARDEIDLKKVLNLPDDFQGFHFAIIGITIHQEWEGDDINELKDLLHFSQLALTLRYLRKGASLLMRMHMSLRLVDCHLLSFMLSLFDKEHSSIMASSTTTVTKPFSTFSMRKTYWVLYNGFKLSAEDEELAQVLKRFNTLLEKDIFGYGWDDAKKDFNKPVLMPMSIEQLLNIWGKDMLGILEQVWEKQVIALKGFMEGKKDILCRYGNTCRRKRRSYRGYNNAYAGVCDKAHSENEIIPEVLEAMNKIAIRAFPRLRELGLS